jgi:acyl dehydratase
MGESIYQPLEPLHKGDEFDLGVKKFSEQEIIDFAKAFDPLAFHTDLETAKKSFFGGLIASGPQLFNFYHSQRWIPRFGKSVICGLEVNHWKFILPTHPNKLTQCTVKVLDIRSNPDKKHSVVKWGYDFRDADAKMMQVLESTVLHYSL